MSDAEFNTKCLLLGIEIEQYKGDPSPEGIKWIVWATDYNKGFKSWHLLCNKSDKSFITFHSRDAALEAYTTNKDQYIWD